tara:strand:- start:82 stop:411 length:330 start_codon:yes stop_codon:yes gene_type:complete
MAKKQKSFADKASGNKDKEMVFVKYVKSVQSDITGRWRFNEQMVKMQKGEQLDTALKRIDEVANLVDIDLSEFTKPEELATENQDSIEKDTINNDLPDELDKPGTTEEE